ncbi:MAG: sugar lactone lactonase YvrE [Saprospiraceae bacterium]|jgi:sugar lactone lactonase YvrE
MNRIKTFLAIFFCTLFIFSCKEDPISDAFPDERIAFLSGIFVTNSGNGTISYYDKLNGQVSQNIFQTANEGSPLGAGLNPTVLIDTLLWISNQNENKITLADPDFMTEVRSFETPNPPRSLITLNVSTAYITHRDPSNSSNDFLTKIDDLGVVDMTFTTKVHDNTPLVSSSTLYLPTGTQDGLDSILTLIHVTADTIIADSIMPAPNPTEIVEQSSNSIWVLCAGRVGTIGDPINGALVHLVNRNINVVISLPPGAKSLVISDGDQYLFYSLSGNVYRQSTDNEIRETTPFIERDYSFLMIDPDTGDLYGGDIGDGTSNGTIYQHDVETGEEKVSFECGVQPNGIVFK